MSPTIRHQYKYFHSTVQRGKDRRKKFHFCGLPFDVRPRNGKLNLSIAVKLVIITNEFAVVIEVTVLSCDGLVVITNEFAFVIEVTVSCGYYQ